MRIINWVSYSVTATVAAMRMERPDVVVGSSPHLLAAVAGLIVARARRSAFVLEVRDIWPKVLVDMDTLSERSVVYRALRRLELELYAHADRVVVLAEGTADYVVTEGIPAERVVLIPNSADPEDFTVGATQLKLRERWGLPPDRLIVIYAGAHGPANGLDLVLDAAGELRDHPEVLFLLVGGGVRKPELVKRAQQEDLDNVTFRDPIPKREMPALLAAADVGLHCLADTPLFRYGVSPNKLFDYMAAGLPVLTNTPGEVSEFVEASGGGIAVVPNEIADGVRRMAELGADRRRELGRRAREHMARTRSRAAMVRRLQDTLDSLTSTP